LGLSWIGERGYVGFSFAGHNSLYGIPAGAHAHHAAHEEEHGESSHDETHAEEGGESVRIDLRQRRFDLQGEWRNPLAGVNALRYTFGHARYRHLELEGGEIGTIYANRGNDVRLEALLAPLGAFEGAFGVQASRSRLDATGEEAFVPPSDTRNRAAFLFEEAVLGPVRWQFGARLEEQRIRLRDDTGIRRKDTTAGLSSGAVWDFGDGWSLGASVSRSERAPTAQELFSDGPHLGTNAYEVGNPGLDAETSLAVDLSLRRRAGRITGALTVFEHRFDGYIYETPTGEEEDELDVYAYVQRDARFRGAEVETVIHLHEGERHRLDVHVAGDFVHGRDRDSGQDLPRMTPRRARLGAVWTNGIWTLGGEAQRVSSQRRVASAETASSGYTLLGAHANLRFTAGRSTFDLFVRGNNLTDREARVHTSFLKDVAPLPGRNVTIGVRTSF
jgi:iron complex outermembrane receptor protein